MILSTFKAMGARESANGIVTLEGFAKRAVLEQYRNGSAIYLLRCNLLKVLISNRKIVEIFWAGRLVW